MLEIAQRERERLVDAHDDVRPAAAHPGGRLFHQRPRVRFLRRRHAVLEIELNAVGAAGVGLVDEFLDVDRHVEQRAPDG
ncbi:hypothetical protein D3C83_74330 [compost metagenome]